MQQIRFSADTLAAKNTTVVSDEVRSDRSTADLLLVASDVQGNLNGELSYGSWDTLLQAVLCGTWSSAGDAVFANGVGNNTTTFVSASASFVSGDVGKTIIGPTIPNGTYIVSITNGTTVVLSNVVPTGTSLAFTIKARTGTGNLLVNGITNRSFLIEVGFLDIAQYLQYTGCVPNTLDLTIASRKQIQLVFAFMGANGTRAGTTASGSIIPANSRPPITAGPYITGIAANTNWTGATLKQLALKINNNLRIHDQVQSLASDDFGRGVLDITFTASLYFKNGNLIDQGLANSASAFSFNIADPLTGGAYEITLPKVKLEVPNPTVPGNNQDVMLDISGQALVDPVSGNQIQVLRT